MATGGSRSRRLHLPEGGSQLPKPIPESALYSTVAEHLASSGYRCWREVSFLGSWLDLFARDDSGHTVCVELKVSHWQSALKQAVRVRNAASEVYIGVWAPYVHRATTGKAQAALAHAGVGLLSINGDCEVRIPAVERKPRYADYVLVPARPSHYPR